MKSRLKRAPMLLVAATSLCALAPLVSPASAFAIQGQKLTPAAALDSAKKLK